MSNQTMYENLLGCLTKNGKKATATSLLKKALNSVSAKFKLPTRIIMRRLSENAGTLIELRAVKIRKNTINVPFPIDLARRRFVMSRDIISSANAIKKKINFSKKLSEQITAYLVTKGAGSKKARHFKNVVKSRSNIHYRW